IQIVDRPLQRSRIVPQMSQNVPVAASAQEPSDALPTRLGTRAARVVVVDRELPACAVRPAADVALAALGLVDRPVLLVRDAVGLFDVCLVRVVPSALPTCPVVRCAPGTGVLRRPSSRDALGQAVLALLGLTPYHGAPTVARSGVLVSKSARTTFSNEIGRASGRAAAQTPA